MPIGFYVFAVLAVFLTSFFGSVCNMYLFYTFATQNIKGNGFRKLCLVKTVSNCIICFSFLFWVFPVTSLSQVYSDLNYVLNRSIGVLSTSWAYLLNSLLQVCLSCNRCYALYFPFGVKKIRHISLTKWAITLSIIVISVFSAITIPEGCGYVYDPNYFLWRPEESECALLIVVLVPRFIYGTTITTNSFNIATAARLVMYKMGGMSKEDSKKRRKRWMVAFTQSVIQDCLQCADIINSYYLWKLNAAAWFQFLFVTLSFIMVTALDGLVMFICNVDIHPKWLKNVLGKQESKRIFVATVVENNSSVK